MGVFRQNADVMPAHPLVLDEGDEPSNLLPQYALAKLGLGIERYVRKHEDTLKKLGIKFENLPLWTKHILTAVEWLHGLATVEKGEWGTDFVLAGKSEAELPILQQKFASSMMWEMTRDIDSDNPKLAINVKVKKDWGGEVSGIVPELTKRDWPMIVRVLKAGVDGKPVAFVDIQLEKSGGDNPYNSIDWQRVIQNDEEYILGLGHKVGPQRYLNDWYDEGENLDKVGSFTRPDILIGNNTHDFSVNSMCSDRRPLLSIGFDESRDQVAGVRVSTLTHLPYDGMDMLGQGPNPKKANIKLSAYEATMQSKEIRDLLDPGGSPRIDGYLEWRDQNDKHINPMKSFLSTRYGQFVPDATAKIETFLRLGSFENPVMQKFSWMVNAQKVVVAREIPTDIVGLLKELPKELRGENKKMSGIFLLNMALFLQTRSSQGYAVKPDDLKERLAYAGVGNPALRRVLEAAGLIKKPENERATNLHLDKRQVVRDLDKVVRGTGSSDEAIKALQEDLLKRGDVMGYRREKVQEIMDSYQGDMQLAKDPRFFIQYENADSDPHELEQRGLIDHLIYQQSAFNLMFDSISGDGEIDSESLAKLEMYSREILKFGSLSEGFPLNDRDVDEVLCSFDSSRHNIYEHKSKLSSDIHITEEIVEWGSTDKREIMNRIVKVRKAMFEATIGRYKQDGVKYLLKNLKDEIDSQDTQEVNSVLDDLIGQAGTVAELVEEFTKKPWLSAMGINVRVGALLRNMEFLGMWGASAIIASARPEKNVSKLVTKDQPGSKACFDTATGGTGTTLGIAQVNDRLSAKEVVDNQVNMLDVALPFMRGNNAVKQNFRLYLERSDTKEKDLALVEKMLTSDEFACFADDLETTRMVGDDYDYVNDQARIWGEKYEDRSMHGATNSLARWHHKKEAGRFFELFTGYLEEVKSGNSPMDKETKKIMNDFMDGGFADLWEAVTRFRLSAVQAEFSQVLLLFGLWRKDNSDNPNYDEEKLIPLRNIRKREMDTLREEHQKLKSIYRGVLGMEESK